MKSELLPVKMPHVCLSENKTHLVALHFKQVAQHPPDVFQATDGAQLVENASSSESTEAVSKHPAVSSRHHVFPCVTAFICSHFHRGSIF